MLTRITDRKIPCVYIHVYRITKNWGPGPYNSLRHADNKIFFGSLSNAKSKGGAHVLLGEGSGEIWTCYCWKKGNFITINEFKYGQTWNIWSSPLSLSLYNPFNGNLWKCSRQLRQALMQTVVQKIRNAIWKDQNSWKLLRRRPFFVTLSSFFRNNVFI